MVDEVPVVLAQTLTAHDDEVLHVAFSHDGKQISSCSKDHHVIIWNHLSEEGRFTEHYRVVQLNFTPDLKSYAVSQISLILPCIKERILQFPV